MPSSRPYLAQFKSCLALLAGAALYGCAGDGPLPSESSGAFAQIQTNIFNQNCLSAGCHNAQSRSGDLNLSEGASYGQLVNVVPQNPVAAGMGLVRVRPFDPDNSFLIIKLTNPGAGEGSRMPQGMDPLPDSDINQIREWILAGAPAGNTPVASGSITPVPTGSTTPVPTGSTAPVGATPTDTPPLTVTAPPTNTAPPTLSDTATVTPTPLNTPTMTKTVTGTPPSTGTVTATATTTETPSPSPTPTETGTPSLFAQIQATIFNQTCTEAFCHDQRGMSGGLVLVEGQSYENLVNVEPQNVPARDAGLLRVKPGDPDNSFLVIKVEGPTDPAMGLRMPSGLPPLSAEQIQLILDWIAQGALQ